MSLFSSYRPFETRGEARGGQLYFNRAKNGPTYEITSDEQSTLKAAMKKLRIYMISVVLGFILVFVLTILALPIILELNPDIVFAIVAVMMVVAVSPFLIMVKLHLSHQRKIRRILGDRRAISRETMAAATAAPGTTTEAAPLGAPATSEPQTRGLSIGKLSAIFLVGVAITTVGVVMLFSAEEMEFRRQLIWWLNLLTGSLLTGLGLYGMIIRQKPPISPMPTPRGDQSDPT